jgi:YegS/Rv2252/BmrU family lipid kinase
VVAVGGDGTVRAVAQGLVGTQSVLGIVPAGSGNDLARTFAIPSRLAEAARVALEGEPVRTDAGKLNGGLFFNVAGVGFDAEVARRFNAPPRWAIRLGIRVRYHLAVIGAFARYPHPNGSLLLDGEAVPVRSLLLAAVGNCRYYGGGLAVCPDADPGDGLFDVVWGEALRLGEILRLMGSMPTGRHLASPKVHVQRCSRLRLECSTPVPYHLDGDVGLTTPVEAEVVPGALLVSTPASGA